MPLDSNTLPHAFVENQPTPSLVENESRLTEWLVEMEMQAVPSSVSDQWPPPPPPLLSTEHSTADRPQDMHSVRTRRGRRRPRRGPRHHQSSPTINTQSPMVRLTQADIEDGMHFSDDSQVWRGRRWRFCSLLERGRHALGRAWIWFVVQCCCINLACDDSFPVTDSPLDNRGGGNGQPSSLSMRRPESNDGSSSVNLCLRCSQDLRHLLLGDEVRTQIDRLPASLFKVTIWFELEGDVMNGQVAICMLIDKRLPVRPTMLVPMTNDQPDGLPRVLTSFTNEPNDRFRKKVHRSLLSKLTSLPAERILTLDTLCWLWWDCAWQVYAEQLVDQQMSTQIALSYNQFHHGYH